MEDYKNTNFNEENQSNESTTQYGGYPYYVKEDKKSNILYDIANFLMIIICISSVGYCIFVPLQNYNWVVFLSIILSACLFGVIAFTTKVFDPQTLFSKMTNYILENVNYTNTFEFVKIITKYTFKACKYLLVLYPVLLLLFAFGVMQTFAQNYMPYGFHPYCSDFEVIMLSIFIIIIFCSLFKFKVPIVGEILGIILFYSFYDEQFYDKIATTCGLIGKWIIGITIGIILAIIAFKTLIILYKVLCLLVSKELEFQKEKEIRKEAIKEILYDKSRRRY